MDNIKEWTYLPIPELLTRASCTNGLMRMSAELSRMPPTPPPHPRRPNQWRDWTELWVWFWFCNVNCEGNEWGDWQHTTMTSVLVLSCCMQSLFDLRHANNGDFCSASPAASINVLHSDLRQEAKICRKDSKEDLCWIIPHLPPPPHDPIGQGTELSWVATHSGSSRLPKTSSAQEAALPRVAAWGCCVVGHGCSRCSVVILPVWHVQSSDWPVLTLAKEWYVQNSDWPVLTLAKEWWCRQPWPVRCLTLAMVYVVKKIVWCSHCGWQPWCFPPVMEGKRGCELA